jgi:hypothetical protein
MNLNGDLTIQAGEFNVSGGSGSYCNWPSPVAGSITMSGGVLDFKDHGIYLVNNSFVENISGGIIRTVGHFSGNSGVTCFTPEGGAVECYGDVNSYIYQRPGCYFHDLYADKNSPYSMVAGTDLIIKGELKVKSSIFKTNFNSITVGE